jgi:cysteine desulfurase
MINTNTIYLDYNATTPVDPRVLEAMLPYFTVNFGNASSASHRLGWVAEEAVTIARQQVAALIHASPEEIIFTSGATEAINLALKGVYEKYKSQRNHIITISTEHSAVLETCNALEKQGARITYIHVDRDGRLDPNAISDAICEQTLLIAVMYANNETGVLQDMEKLAQIAHENSVFFMTDSTQAIGKVRVDVMEDGIDILCLSAHKLYGPKGSGALYIRQRNPKVRAAAQLHGGSHEFGLRAGTLNVPGIVGLGKACELAKAEMWDDNSRISKLRTVLEQHLTDLGNVYVNGSQKNRLPNVSNLWIEGVSSQDLTGALPSLAFSTGSACQSASGKPSHVLSAMGLSIHECRQAIRLSLGKQTTIEEIQTTIERMTEAIHKIRQSKQ